MTRVRPLSLPAWIGASALGTAAFLSTSCGGGSPVEPVAVTPAPTATATPAPATGPTPTPAPCVVAGTCEAPTTNTNPPTRVELRVFLVRKPDGDPAPCSEADPAAPGGPAPNTRYWFAPIPVGYRVTIDATAFDQFNKPTNHDCRDDNRGCLDWRLQDGQGLIEEFSSGHIFQPKFLVTGAGDFQIQAEMYNNGSRVRSPWMWLKFVADRSQSPCGR
jgi:hypothetical protein